MKHPSSTSARRRHPYRPPSPAPARNLADIEFESELSGKERLKRAEAALKAYAKKPAEEKSDP